MSTNKYPDSLDKKIDSLLASQPLRPSPDFARSVVVAAKAVSQENRTGSDSPQDQSVGPVAARSPSKLVHFALRFAFPAAAAIALSLWVINDPADAPVAEAQEALSVSELEEVFLLEEPLLGLEGLLEAAPSHQDLTFLLDPLFPAIES
ncbi:MAG: hypothetical protein R6U56_09415 [Opitutales bacterium]